ncbi:unnamed protein product, partial [Didymodactylos carnosus]
MTCLFEYSTDLFQRSTIETICQRFQVLLKQLFTSSFDLEKQPVYELSILLPDELKLIHDINETHVDYRRETRCIHHDFVDSAQENWQKMSIILDEQSLTYAETLYYVQKLSVHLIQEYQVKPQQIICQCIERSIEMILGILTILSIGAIYTPLSPNDPSGRLYSLLSDMQAHYVLIHTLTEEKFAFKSN